MKKKALLASFLALGALVLSGCGESTVYATGIEIVDEAGEAIEELEMVLGGDSVALGAVVTPEDATDVTIAWTVDAEDVVSIEDGVVTALAAGTAIITATANGAEEGVEVTDTLAVTVFESSYAYTFENLTGTATSTAMSVDELTAAFAGGYEGEGEGIVVAATDAYRIYEGNGNDSGAYPKSSGFIKTGSSSDQGYFTVSLAHTVSKVEVLCHDWFALSDSYPTNSNTLAVGDAAAQLVPYTADATAGWLTFEFTATDTLTFTGNYRVIIFEIVFYI